VNENLLRGQADALLRELAGPTAILREDQWKAIDALVSQHRRVLVVQRTGWGKSAVYFLATALLRRQGSEQTAIGPTVIISPLLALMRNQIAAASKVGIRAHTMNSANPEEWDQVQAAVAAGEVDVLLVSPERLNNPDFRDSILPKLTASAGLVVVDEAHCISDWGHDFRPDYRRLRTLIKELPSEVPVLATTATANNRVVTDVAEQLGFEESTRQQPLVLRGPLDRESLRLAVTALPTPEARLAWLAENLENLPGSGIIYTLTVAGAHDVASFLRERGYAVSAYTGKTETAERMAAEEDLLENRVKALVATSALGMGFDKPDLGFVVHLGAPSSPIAYYQQVGRAGRGVEKAEVILLPGKEDQEIWAYFGSLAFPDEARVNQVLDALTKADNPLSTVALEPVVELSRSRLEMVLKVLDVDGAVRRVRGGWESTGEPWLYDAERYARVNRSREVEQQAMLDYQSTASCRMEFLLQQLDDPAAKPCQRCDNCTGKRRPTEVSAAIIETTKKQLRKPGVEISPRKQWPSGLRTLSVPLSGRISSTEQNAAGRTLGRLTDIGWGNQLRALLNTGSAQSVQPAQNQPPIPEGIIQACITVLAEWNWDQRPVAIVAIPSHSRPGLSEHLAHKLAEIGKLDYWGNLRSLGGPPHKANSAQRVAELWNRLSVPEELAAKVAAADGPVLLIDDLVDSGWTMALAGRLLREAGARSVLPFALASTT
jgi:ATP-dependent DNA helicase RecQ